MSKQEDGMKVQKIDAKTFRKMFLAGAKLLEIQKEYVNELNVFPVPDGDTGTNMTMTILSAAREVEQVENGDMKARKPCRTACFWEPEAIPA